MNGFPGIGQGLSAKFAHQLSELVLEPGRSLPRRVCGRMETGLGADFASVTIHTSQAAQAICAQLGALAFALGDHIGFARGAYQPDTEPGARLLAHELAHVVQQRRGRAAGDGLSASRQRIEQEADAAADAVMRGEGFDCRLADASGLPACWDLAGHYYTTYLALLNARVDKATAERLALWCWLPDQVEEFEAVYVGEHYFIHSAGWHHSKDIYEKYDPSVYLNEFQYVAAIQRGFHVLTGGSSAEMTEECGKRFVNANDSVKLLYRGIMLHAYGDCFAHREFGDASSLYGKTAPIGHGLVGHAPDNIWDERRGKIYVDYVRGLCQLASDYSHKPGIVSTDELVAALSGMVVFDTAERDKFLGLSWEKTSAKARTLAQNAPRSEKGCCDHIRRVATELVGIPMSSRHPSEEPVPWEDYYNRLKSWIIQDSEGKDDREDIFLQILIKAIGWSRVSLLRKGQNPATQRNVLSR